MSAEAPVYELHNDPSSSFDEKHADEEKEKQSHEALDEQEVQYFDAYVLA